MNLRPYQEECLNAIADAAAAGVNRQLVVLPTASGKTVTFAQLPNKLGILQPDKMLVLVQSTELCFQAVDKIQRCNPGLKVGLEKAQYESHWNDDVVVASVQTLNGSKYDDASGRWEWSKRLKRLDPEAFTTIVVDEVHHCIGSMYHGVLRYFKVYKPEPQFNDPSRLLLGVTATPNRSDNKGLESFFDKIVYSRDIRTMVNEGWLAKPEAHRINTMVSLDGVAFRGGDFVTSALEKEINVPARNKLIVDKYLELGENAPFLAFTCDIQHTIDLTNAFRDRGIECYGIASKSGVESPWLLTKEEDRKQGIERFSRGEFRGLLSCQALLEGFDAPNAMVGLDGSPTASALRFTQKFGRVLRPYPAPEQEATWQGWRKRCAIWLDFADSSSRHSLMTAPSLFGLKSDFNAKGKNVIEIVEEVERIKAAKPGINLNLYDNLDTLRGMAEKIDVFAIPTVPPEVEGKSQFSWTTGVTEGMYQLSLPDKGMLSVKVTTLGEYEVAKHLNGIKTPIGTTSDLVSALKLADKNVPAEAMIILRSDANWRKLPVSQAQCGLLAILYPDMRRMYRTKDEFDKFVQQQYSRGQVSALIAARDKRKR